MRFSGACLFVLVCLWSWEIAAKEPAAEQAVEIDFVFLPLQHGLLPGEKVSSWYFVVDRYQYKENSDRAAGEFTAQLVRSHAFNLPTRVSTISGLPKTFEVEPAELSIASAVSGLVAGEAGQAVTRFQRVYAYCKRRFGEKHLATTVALNNLGVALQFDGRLAEAQMCFEQALTLQQKLFPSRSYPKPHYCLINAVGALGGVHAARGEFDTASKYFQRALAMFRARSSGNRLPTTLPTCAATLEGLDLVYAARNRRLRESGRPPTDADRRGELAFKAEVLEARAMRLSSDNHELAIVNYQAALEILKRIYPNAEDPIGLGALARAQNNVAFLFEAKKEYRWAQEYFSRAYELEQREAASEGMTNSAGQVRVLTHLGIAFAGQRRYSEAIKYYRRALAMAESLYTEKEHPLGHDKLVEILNLLSAALRLQGEYDQASACAGQSVQMCQRMKDPSVPAARGAAWIEALLNQAAVLQSQIRFDDARQPFETALSAFEALQATKSDPAAVSRLKPQFERLKNEFHVYDERVRNKKTLEPKEEFPRGWPDNPMILEMLSFGLAEHGELNSAISRQRQALRSLREYFPPGLYPAGHERVATALGKLGRLLLQVGEIEEARQHLEEAFAMREQLYPLEEHPHGHLKIAESWQDKGNLLRRQGDFQRARQCLEESLAIQEKLYAGDEHQQGHSELIRSLCNLGHVLIPCQQLDRAKSCYQEAQDMWQKLYPEETFQPEEPLLDEKGRPGHAMLSEQVTSESLLADVYRGLGRVDRYQGKYRQAEARLRRALEIQQARFPKSLYKTGHPQLAQTLCELGLVLLQQGKFELAAGNFDRAAEFWKALYPNEKRSQGSPDYAVCLNGLGKAFMLQGDGAKAIETFEREAIMRLDLATAVFDGMSEAESLNFAAAHLTPPNDLISAWNESGKSDAHLYQYIWTRRGRIQQTLTSRRRLLRDADSPQIQSVYQRYLAVRKALAQQALAAAQSESGRAAEKQQALTKISDQKEKLERFLASALPKFRRRLELQRTSPAALSRTLPSDVVFVDVLKYARFVAPDPGPDGWNEDWQPSYVAFLVRAGMPALRIELGEAAPIETAVKQWRDQIINRVEDSAAHELSKLIWSPIEKHLPKHTRSIVICPDAALTAVPWAALPDSTGTKLLIENYGFTVVPSGQFLLDTLIPKTRRAGQTNRALVVGEVNYDVHLAAPAATGIARTTPSAIQGDRKLARWQPLPGTTRELASLDAVAGSRSILRLTDAEATTTRVLSELPHVRWAHLATHGFFADDEIRSTLQFAASGDPKDDSPAISAAERTTTVGRNPLVLAGLVLAGANEQNQESARGALQLDQGILTAEAIAAMPLDGLELAVLSACETGLGDVAGGEGVYGLQRAFHIAGARNVVASLWKVDDQATAALMKLFYENLWQKKLPPIKALRQAQLAMLLSYNPAVGR